MRRCSKCRVELPLDEFAKSSTNGRQAYCKRCHAASMREWRSRNPGADKERYRSDESFREKARARSRDRAREKRRSGLRPCTRCGSGNAQIHHTKYTKPSAFEWLCQRCHAAERYPEAQERAAEQDQRDAKLNAIAEKFKDR